MTVVIRFTFEACPLFQYDLVCDVKRTYSLISLRRSQRILVRRRFEFPPCTISSRLGVSSVYMYVLQLYTAVVHRIIHVCACFGSRWPLSVTSEFQAHVVYYSKLSKLKKQTSRWTTDIFFLSAICRTNGCHVKPW